VRSATLNDRVFWDRQGNQRRVPSRSLADSRFERAVETGGTERRGTPVGEASVKGMAVLARGKRCG